MILNLEKLPSFDKLAIIINVDTKVSSTLAILSAIRYCHFPVLLVDCSKDISEIKYFEEL
jgi:hypothetical protein